jgi:aldehyde:ferredoxin oxidoreductase
MKIIRVDMGSLQVLTEEIPKEYEILGNRGLIAKTMINEVTPTCHPLSRFNKLIFASGPLAGTGVPTAGRLSVGGKSPLTGGIKESNSGGIFAGKLVQNGIKAIIIEDKPEDTSLYTLVVSQDQCEIVRSEALRGLGNYEVHRRLLGKYGKDAAIASIGPAGEARLLTAGIFGSDIEGLPGAVCARGALGSLMGSKRLKAVVVLGKGTYRIPIKYREKFIEALKRYHEVISKTPQTAEIFPKYGTSAALMTLNELGALPTRNFRAGQFEKAQDISAEALYETIVQRGGEGKTTHRCMPGCTIQCYNKYPDKDGKLMVSPLQYETMSLLGSNLGIGDLDTIAQLNYLCNDVGVDTVELGVALGMAMGEGLIPFGDGRMVEQVILGIPKGEMFSKILASGAVVTGKAFGIERVPAVKGQGIPAHEPRAVKGMGVTFSVTPMGADHTTGITFREKVDHHRPEGQVMASLRVQLKHTAYDALGLCYFVGTAVGVDNMLTVDLINAVYGTDLRESFINELGKEVLKTERAFNEAAGLTRAHDRLPDFFRYEKLPPHNLTFDVPQEDIDRFWEELETA